jgi:hypothetical protein
MGQLDVVEAESPTQRLDGLARRRHCAALFQLHVPLGADAGEPSHLFPLQPRCSPPALRDGSHVLGTQPCPARAQKVAELAIVVHGPRPNVVLGNTSILPVLLGAAKSGI